MFVFIFEIVYWFGCSLLSFLFFSLFLFCECVCMFLCVIFVCLVLLLPFVLGSHLFVFWGSFLVLFLFCIVFTSYFSCAPCGLQGIGALAGGQARASEVGEPSLGRWTTRELLAPWNIYW